MSTSTPVVFNFVSQTLRVVIRDGEPWFVAADVCAVLGITTKQTRRLDDDENGLHSTQTPSGAQEMTVINESGLYSLILGSSKPEAKKYKKWVTSEVLPAIRKTGRYEVGTGRTAPPEPAHEQLSNADLGNLARMDEAIQDEEGDEPFCNCSEGHSIEETDWNQCDSCGKPIYDEEPAVPPTPTFADGMTAENDRRFMELTNNLTHNAVIPPANEANQK